MSWSTAKSLCLALASSLALAGCNQLEAIATESGGSGGGELPPAVREAFEGSCGLGPCHGPGANQPVLAGDELETSLAGTSLAGIPYVTRGDIKNSYIAIAMLPDGLLSELDIERTVERMPRGGPFTGANIETILAWIAGAEFPGGVGTTSGGTDTTDSGGMTTGAAPEPTFANVQAIFTQYCVACHTGAPNPATNGNLILTEGMAYANLVGVGSSQAPTWDRVAAGDPSASYLYLKLAGGYDTTAGGTGTLMPPPMGMLDPAKVTLIEDWITAGALEN